MKMTAIRTIVYVGKDEEFNTELFDFSRTFLRSNFEVLAFEYKRGILLKAGQDLEPSIIFIDEWSDDEKFLEELTAFRSFRSTKSTPIVALCKDKEEADRLSGFLTLGVHMLFIKGSDIEPFFKDCFYLGFDEKLGFPKYATAEGLDLEMKIGLLSTVTWISNESMLIETDCELKDGERFPLKLPFLDSNPILNCEVKKRFSISSHYPMLSSYELLFPYTGPWDEVTEETIQPETVETWLNFNEESFDQRQQLVRLYTEDLNFASQCLLEENLNFLDFKEKILPLNQEELELKRPSIFFIEINENNSFDDVHFLTMQFLNIPDYNPIIIILNSSSSSEALRKIFNYPFIIASPEKISHQVFRLLMDKFSLKKISQSPDTFRHFFKKSDFNRLASLILNVRITGLNEHEVTFLSEVEIPFFSVLKFDLPIPFFVTVIPPFNELFKRETHTHSMGIIHGLSEKDLEKLRKIVNQMIYHPVKELNKAIIENMLKQDYSEASSQSSLSSLPLKEEKKGKVEMVEAMHAVESSKFKVKRKNYIGKSKL